MAEKFFATTKKGEIPEIREELNGIKEDKKKFAVKKVIALMTVGKDMSALFTDVLKCITTNNLELKKLVYLYVMNYAKSNQENAILAVNTFHKDASDPNPLIRALAIRTMGMIRVDKVVEYLPEPLRAGLKDTDPYVAKTAALCVAKLYDMSPELVENQGFLDMLLNLLGDSNHTVVSNAVAALTEIDEIAATPVWKITRTHLSKMLTAMEECTEWGQVSILTALGRYTPRDAKEAETIVDRVAPRLNHANSAVKVILLYVDVIATANKEKAKELVKKLRPPLVTLLSKEPELQYVALRNIRLICQRHRGLLGTELKVFFCKYNDPVYVKMEKLELLIMLVSEKTLDQVLLEFKEYATKVDVDFVRKAVRAIGRAAIKIESGAEKCVHVLLDLIRTTQANYVIQEAIIVLKDIFRKYPNRYESVIGTLCDRLEALDEPEAKAAMIWTIGEYAHRIDNAEELLENWNAAFKEEPTQVQLQLLTATVKLFLKKPAGQTSQKLVQDVLKIATTECDNPDLRDRGFIYWRLLSVAPEQAKKVVLAEKPPLDDQADMLDPALRDELLVHIGSLASVYHKLPQNFVPRMKGKLARRVSRSMPTTRSPLPAAQTPPPQPAPVADLLGGLDLSGSGSSMPPASHSPASMGNLLDNISTYNPSAPSVPSTGSPPLLSSGGVAAPGTMTTVLRPTDEGARGLQVDAGFGCRDGQVMLNIAFTNTSGEVASGFMVKFNKNAFSMNPSSPVQVQSLAPGQTERTSLPISRGELNPELLSTDQVQVALKSSLGVAMFFVPLPVHAILSPDGRLEKTNYLQMWRSIQSEHYTDLSPVFSTDIGTITSRLESFNIFPVAQRNVSGQDFLYLSARLFDEVLLIELAFTGSSCKCCVKANKEELVQPMQSSMAKLLTA